MSDPWNPSSSREQTKELSGLFISARYKLDGKCCVEFIIHLAVCLTTGPKSLPKRALHVVRYRASSFKCEYPLLFLRSFGSYLRRLPRLPVTFIPLFTFPSITFRRRQLLRKMWPIQLAFRLLVSCRIFLCPLTRINLLALKFGI
jgi:hypothetical protein